MCGRYASSRSRTALLETFDVDSSSVDEELAADYNVAPTKVAPVVVARTPQDEPESAPVRQLRNLRWGLVPSWAKDPKIGSRMINARAETVHEKPAFRRAFKTRRCLVPVDAFYEWFETQELGKSGKPLKQPFAIRPSDGEVLALAGLYEFWHDTEKPADWLVTFAIITTTATDDVGRIHDRMPMAVPRERWGQWLDPRVEDADEVRALMAPPTQGTLEIYPVAKAVNNVRNNGPELLEPLPAQEDAPS
jgi:putative SOS response-associated peptidase YedK